MTGTCDIEILAALMATLETSLETTDDQAAKALAFVRDGIITGEGPTTRGRVHFSRALDAVDVAWCHRILTAPALAQMPVSRAEIEILFQIDAAASERSDDGRFDDLFARAVAHHTAAASGIEVPPRAVALAAETPIESWAPAKTAEVDTQVLEWLSRQMRGTPRRNAARVASVAMLIGAAVPIAQSLPALGDLGL